MYNYRVALSTIEAESRSAYGCVRYGMSSDVVFHQPSQWHTWDDIYGIHGMTYMMRCGMSSDIVFHQPSQWHTWDDIHVDD